MASTQGEGHTKGDAALLAGESRVLALLGEGAPLAAVLDELVRLAEELTDGLLASVLLLHDGRLRHGAAPNLPSGYVRAIDGAAIGPRAGSCGTAAFRGEPVIVVDIETDPLWEDYRQLARDHGLRACWSTPIASGERVLGTFALYYREPRGPSPDELALIERLTRLARIAIARTEADQALRDSEELKSAMLDASLDAIVCMDHTGRILEFNQAAERIFGRDREQTLGRPLADLLVPADQRDRHRRGLANYLATGRSTVIGQRIERSALRADGTEFPVELAILAIAGGEAPVFVGYLRDLSDRRRAEEERRRLEAQILHAQKLESLGVLAGGIAHDFNNLLTAILGYTKLALPRLPAESEARPMLEEVTRGAERAAELAQQMLAYSGRASFRVGPVALDEVVREMVRFLQSVVSKKASIRLDLEPAALEGDETQIRQVVMNLVTNASDALGEREGVIAVRTRVARLEGEALRSPHLPEEPAAGEFAVLEVADDGCGMAEDVLARIFDPFFTTKFTGRGLGLAAVLGVVRGHRGTLTVESAPGRGTRFRVALPTAVPLAAAAEISPAFLPGALAGEAGTALVVDDEESVRGFVRRVLELQGYRVLSAADGREGVALFESHADEIRLVVLDLTMPQMDGLEVAARLAARRPDVPIVLMSGYSQQETESRSVGTAVAAFLQKPFSPRELAQAAGRAIAARAAG